MISRIYSWIPDLPDHRDFMLAAPTGALLKETDVRNAANVVVDQGQLGSCTGNSIGVMDFWMQVHQGMQDAALSSRLGIYYGERLIEGTVKQDAGAQIRDGLKVLATVGAGPERLWPYDISKFAKKPPVKYFTAAKKHRAISYHRIDNTQIEQLIGCLSEGFPFVFGFSVYSSFESQDVAKTGMVDLPKISERQLGGHAVKCVGSDDATERFLVQNSWGPDWGQKGFFTIPYAYLTNANLADDFWTIRSIS